MLYVKIWMYVCLTALPLPTSFPLSFRHVLAGDGEVMGHLQLGATRCPNTSTHATPTSMTRLVEWRDLIGQWTLGSTHSLTYIILFLLTSCLTELCSCRRSYSYVLYANPTVMITFLLKPIGVLSTVRAGLVEVPSTRLRKEETVNDREC